MADETEAPKSWADATAQDGKGQDVPAVPAEPETWAEAAEKDKKQRRKGEK